MNNELLWIFIALVFVALFFVLKNKLRQSFFERNIKFSIQFNQISDGVYLSHGQGVLLFTLEEVNAEYAEFVVYRIKSHNTKVTLRSFNRLNYQLPVGEKNRTMSLAYIAPKQKIADIVDNTYLTIHGYLKKPNGDRRYVMKKIKVAKN